MAGGWTSERLLSLCRGFQPACVIVAAAELDVFTALAARPSGADELAKALDADARGVRVLLDALVALELLEKADGRYGPAAGAAALLSEQGPENVLGIVRHLGNCLRRWSRLGETVRTGRAPPREAGLRGEAGDLASFIRGMDDVSGPLTAVMIEKLRPLAFRHLLDVGGGAGTWTIAFLQAAPDARATLFDLPEVVELARPRIEAAGLADRVTLVGGDFLADDLPGGADFAWVSSIVHQNSRDQNRRLLGKVFSALAAGGRIAVRDVVMSRCRTSPAAGALFAVNMLVGTEAGGTYTFDELAEDLRAAGFADPALLRRGEGTDSLIRAFRPAGD